MSGVHFETPENVVIHYQPAGLGTRFMAWMLDWLFLLIPFFLILAALIANHTMLDGYMREAVEDMRLSRILLYLLGIYIILWGLLTVLYFGFFELIMGGQTPGKKIMKLRVVKAEGFALDAGSVVVRTMFRVLDNFPPLWAVVLLNGRSQRLGDIVAGTLVIHDAPDDARVQHLKEMLLADTRRRPGLNFNPLVLKQLPDAAIGAAERLLLRWDELPTRQKNRFTEGFCAELAKRNQLPAPTLETAQAFLEDFLLTEYRQQYRQLG